VPGLPRRMVGRVLCLLHRLSTDGHLAGDEMSLHVGFMVADAEDFFEGRNPLKCLLKPIF
jgi:hypothetical protein